jgi:hypothetical protein
MEGKIPGGPVGPGIGGSAAVAQKTQKAFGIQIQDFTFCPVGIQGSQKFGDARRGFTWLSYRGGDQNHFRWRENAGLQPSRQPIKVFNLLRPALSFFRGDFFQAEPLAIHPAVIDQVGMSATDAMQDFLPSLHLPLD